MSRSSDLSNLKVAKTHRTCLYCYIRILRGSLYRMAFGGRPYCCDCWRKVAYR